MRYPFPGWWWLVLAGYACLQAGAALAATGEATSVVKRVQTSLISVMKEATQLGYEGRFSGLESVVWQTHDIPFVAKVALGKHWPRLDEQQRTAFISTFAKLSTATYAARFDEYHGERFRIVAESPLPRGKGLLVESRLIKANGEEVHFNYLLHQVGDDWKIINIIVNGVSDLAVKRAEYTKLMDDSGFSALMVRLEEQIQTYAASH